jgi:hypothetical protein
MIIILVRFTIFKFKFIFFCKGNLPIGQWIQFANVVYAKIEAGCQLLWPILLRRLGPKPWHPSNIWHIDVDRSIHYSGTLPFCPIHPIFSQLALITFCYTAISVRLGKSVNLRSKKKECEWQMPISAQRNAATKRRQRTNRMFIAMTLAFSLSWGWSVLYNLASILT